MSPCSSAPFRWGRRSCLGLRTGVSPHFSMNSVREILALRGGYERGRIPLPSPMPPDQRCTPAQHAPDDAFFPLLSSRYSCLLSFSFLPASSDLPLLSRLLFRFFYFFSFFSSLSAPFRPTLPKTQPRGTLAQCFEFPTSLEYSLVSFFSSSSSSSSLPPSLLGLPL